MSLSFARSQLSTRYTLLGWDLQPFLAKAILHYEIYPILVNLIWLHRKRHQHRSALLSFDPEKLLS